MAQPKFQFAFLVFLLTVETILSQQKDHESLCAAQQTCTSCIQSPGCVWCSISGPAMPLLRCVTRDKWKREGNHWCPVSKVVDEVGSMDILENEPLFLTTGKDPVQIQPQKMSLRLRRGEEFRISLKYSQAEDYPVDLYYLMDLSLSMRPYRDSLSILGLKLAETMRKLTSNFRLGFGSFVDKVVLPMTNTQEDKLKNPCEITGTGKRCAPPYGYKNQMPLTENAQLFKSRVQEAPISGNIDLPEGGLDAMMQAMVCTKEIGWRQKARRLLVFSTDDTFHIAGDGKLAGIIEPNDGLCHLSKDGFYTHSLLQDYPSISQINRKAREHNVNIIFAVPSHKNSTYQLLSRSISGSSIGLLENDSKNVVDLVSREYEKLVDSVTITDNAPKIIDVKYFSKCLEGDEGELRERNECGGLRVGNIVQFEILLKVIECPKDPKDWKQTFRIKPRGINESLTVDVELICDCPCDRSGNSGNIPNSPECKGKGTEVCGICSCNDGFYGNQCECQGNEIGRRNTEFFDACRTDNSTSEICSGHGICKCGVCDCNKRANPQEFFYGKFCECDNFSCKRSGGLVCGGKGKCECGTCNCFPGWGGETCDCKESNSTCTPSGENSQICNGRGDCICGTCHCHEKDKIRYSGQYCEECPTCPSQRCEKLKNCVECLAYNSGPLAKEDKCSICPHQIEMVDLVEEDPSDVEAGARICRMPGDEGCTFTFKYKYLRGGDIKIYEIQAQKERDCPAPVNVMGVAIGVVVSTVILGFLVLLVWKILTMLHDQREYVKFEKERALAKFDRGENPLYKQATSTFSNPTFNRSMSK